MNNAPPTLIRVTTSEDRRPGVVNLNHVKGWETVERDGEGVPDSIREAMDEMGIERVTIVSLTGGDTRFVLESTDVLCDRWIAALATIRKAGT